MTGGHKFLLCPACAIGPGPPGGSFHSHPANEAYRNMEGRGSKWRDTGLRNNRVGSTVGPVRSDQFVLTDDPAFGMGVRFAPRSTPVASGVRASSLFLGGEACRIVKSYSA